VKYNCYKCQAEINISKQTVYPFTCPGCGHVYKVGCFRCKIPMPNANRKTAIYGMPLDAIRTERRTVRYFLVDPRSAEDRGAEDAIRPEQLPDEALEAIPYKEEYREIEDRFGVKRIRIYPENYVRTITREVDTPVQATAVICRECYDEETDTAERRIWGSPHEIDANDLIESAKAVAESILENAQAQAETVTDAVERRAIIRAARNEAETVILEGKSQAARILKGLGK